jgi:calcineurin-like phosphoesterase family protein
MGLYFTSDTHFGHINVLKFDKRPFKDIHEHDAQLIQRWNETVTDKDDVWHLGDFAYRADKPVSYYLNQLKGRIHLVKGNHDTKYAWREQELFASTQDVMLLKYHKQKIYLSHYSGRTWPGAHKGSWHLFGHSHGGLPPLGRSFDVGVNKHNYKPISFEQVYEFMRGRGLIDDYPEPEIASLEKQIWELQERLAYLRSLKK